MKTILYLCLPICIFIFIRCNNTGKKQPTDSSAITVNQNAIEKIVKPPLDTIILGVPYYRIDSANEVGKNSGGRPANDSTTAMYLRLTDSIRILGNHILDFKFPYFQKSVKNKKLPETYDTIIYEYHEGILSIETRIKDQPINTPPLLTSLEFYDEQGQLIKKFDVTKNNPYYYDQTRKIKRHVYPIRDDISSHLESDSANWKKYVKEYHSYSKYFVQSNGYVAIDYMLAAIDKEGDVLTQLSTVLVLDTLGNVCTKLIDIPGSILNMYLLMDKKYLFVSGGGILGPGFAQLSNAYLKIYDAKTSKEVYSESAPTPDIEFSMTNESSPPGKIGVSISSWKRKDMEKIPYFVFDPHKRRRCQTLLTKDQTKHIHTVHDFNANNWLRNYTFDCKTY